jgi:PEGA domain
MKHIYFKVVILLHFLILFNTKSCPGQNKEGVITTLNSSSTTVVPKMVKDSSQSKMTINISEVSVVAGKLPTSISLHITSSPVGLNLNIDGKPVGKTPYTAVLAFNMHDFKLTDGKRIIQQHIKINREFPSTLHFDLYNCNAPRTIKSKPSGATVYLNRKEMGVTPLTIKNMNQSDTLQLKKKEYLNYKKVISCKDSALIVKLEPSNPFDYREYVSLGLGMGGGPILLNKTERGQNDQVEWGVNVNFKVLEYMFLKNELNYSYIYNESSMIKRNHLACIGYPILDGELVFMEYGIGFDNFKGNSFQSDLFGIGFGSHRHSAGLRYAAAKNGVGIYSYEGYIKVGL